MSKKFRSNNSQILLTEGKNDCHVIAALCQFHTVAESFGLNDCESDDQVFKKLGALLRTETTKTIGIVLDADNPDLAAKWQKFQTVLSRENIHVVPEKPDTKGTIISATDEHPRIGLWLMPNNCIDGMLEDFCIKMADLEPIAFAEKCVSTAKAQGYTSFGDTHHSKAVVHTYLAWQDEPGNPLGLAITAKVLDPKHPLAITFVDWLNNLFNT